MGTTKREATIDELLADPMMVTVLQYSRTTANEVRALMRDARRRLAQATPADAEEPERS
jgi:hypothetical protein